MNEKEKENEARRLASNALCMKIGALTMENEELRARLMVASAVIDELSAEKAQRAEQGE